MRKVMAVLVLWGVFLAGCGGRELEDSSFPTVLVARDGNIWTQEEERQTKSGKYIDYGQVKAVVISEEAVQDGETLKVILSYLKSNPVFASNLLVFAGSDQVCELAETDEKMGLYLENLAKNQPDGDWAEVSLKELLNYTHNGEPSIQLPLLGAEEGAAVLEGSIQLSQEAAAAVSMPIPAAVDSREQ